MALYPSARRDPRLAPVGSLSIWKTRPATLRRLTGPGAPIAATYGSEAGFFSDVALLVGSFGTAALAAHTAVNQLVYIVFQIAVGLSHAASLGVSRELAFGDTAAARRLKSTALACAAAVMTVVAIVYVVLPGAVLAAFFEGDSRTATDPRTSS
ncbi:MATE family efflux transporter [Streptomyces europaeiscabiei]|uniref:MATE family efflux transporter n=1 Tax=Streptomyces europaeiscabiei TaxID=146819 RepID=UPI0029C9BDC2|nr:MATE family efflux transporter [Streptomyces europaeiscabiei]